MDPIAEGFVGEYFKLAADGYLCEATCTDLDGRLQASDKCSGVQIFDGDDYGPDNYETYVSARKYWDAELFVKRRFEKQRTIIAPLPRGTIFQITRLVDYPLVPGRQWIVRAEIITSDHAGLEVQIPTLFPTASHQMWLKDTSVTKTPVFESKYLLHCPSRKC